MVAIDMWFKARGLIGRRWCYNGMEGISGRIYEDVGAADVLADSAITWQCKGASTDFSRNHGGEDAWPQEKSAGGGALSTSGHLC